MRSLPLLQGEGAHPPADACDFARFCSALDFWSINDHAEGITPRTGTRPRRRSASATRSPAIPRTPTSSRSSAGSGRRSAPRRENHYGHKNVIFRDTDEDRVPTRPISVGGPARVGAARDARRRSAQRLLLPLLDFENRAALLRLRQLSARS